MGILILLWKKSTFQAAREGEENCLYSITKFFVAILHLVTLPKILNCPPRHLFHHPLGQVILAPSISHTHLFYYHYHNYYHHYLYTITMLLLLYFHHHLLLQTLLLSLLHTLPLPLLPSLYHLLHHLPLLFILYPYLLIIIQKTLMNTIGNMAVGLGICFYFETCQFVCVCVHARVYT